jgi:hypothetical protein
MASFTILEKKDDDVILVGKLKVAHHLEDLVWCKGNIDINLMK